jgi:UDP-2-acetamido-3-amino-2,3-dideoxy-glucuronate N-acetyltransferase
MIHNLSDVQSKKIGQGTHVWQFSVILEGAKIGENCNINCHTFIENHVIIGNNVTIKSGVYIWDGITIEDDVFIGPSVAFVNDAHPRSKSYPVAHLGATVRKGASIGANSTIMGNLEIGELAMVGAGSVVTKSVPARALVIGVPAKVIGWLNEDGSKMRLENGYYFDNHNTKWKVVKNKLEQI